ncbi:MAG: DNA polymerase III subunit beta [Verrucomicrobiota bacterium]|nr:DNA polymerase III subunit beta [Verrucomicrobiota bacterium]
MKLTISRDQLMNGLQAVQNVVSTRTTLPILSNVLLRAEGERLALTATDLDITVSSSVTARVVRPGATTLPAKRLFGIVRELSAAEIELDVDEKNHCSIQSGPSFYKINGLAAEEFPPIPTFTENKKIIIAQEKLRALLKRTSFAISTDETRFVLNGIFMSLNEHRITMVATDGRRLALSYEEMDIPANSQAECIVPSKAINELSRLLQGQGDVEIRLSTNQIAFTLTHLNANNEPVPGAVIISKLIEGNYPNYKQVIPAETKERISLLREELHAALRRAEIMTSEKSNSVKLTFTKNNLAITANTPEIGEGRESIAVNYKGKDIAIAFNPTYLMDPLKALTEEEVYLELIDDLSPGLLKVNGPFLYVLMPMRMS